MTLLFDAKEGRETGQKFQKYMFTCCFKISTVLAIESGSLTKGVFPMISDKIALTSRDSIMIYEM